MANKNKELKIAFDVRPLQTGSAYRGVGVYVRELLYHLSKIDKTNQYFLIFRDNLKRPDFKLEEGFKRQFLPVKTNPLGWDRLNVIYDYFFLKKQIGKVNPDVIHFTNPLELNMHYNMGGLNGRSIVTFHDLTPYLFKTMIFRGNSKLLWPIYRHLLFFVKNVKHIISVSRNTRDDLIKFLDVPPEKITVIHHGPPEVKCSDDRQESEDIDDSWAVEEITQKNYILYVGAASPQKNVDMLIEMLTYLLDNFKSLDVDLLITGSIHPRDKRRLDAIAQNYGVGDRVKYTGFLKGRKLGEVYANASCVAFPSLYEGFGFPALEAMQAGVPLIASDASSIPEVVGEAGILVEPVNAEKFASAVSKVLTDPDLAKDLVERGKQRLKKFSWKKTAQETLRLYQEM